MNKIVKAIQRMVSQTLSFKLDPSEAKILKAILKYYHQKCKTPKGKRTAESARITGDFTIGSFYNLTQTGKTQKAWLLEKFQKFCDEFESKTNVVNDKSKEILQYINWKAEIIKKTEAFNKNESLETSSQFTLSVGKNFLKLLVKTYWYTYELENGKISRRILEFKNFVNNKYCDFELTEPERVLPGEGIFVS